MFRWVDPLRANAADVPSLGRHVRVGYGVLMLDTHSWLTLVPPLVAIALVLITRKVVPSLGAGIIAAGLLLGNFSPLPSLQYMGEAILGLVWEDGGINWYTILIVAFLFQLGMLTTIIMMSGGAYAFTEWASKRIKTRMGAQALAAGLGMLIFIDDYFNALAVGQVARPVTDKYRVSRAKLAYLIDSSSAPVVVLMPFSSWGATIMGIMAPLVLAAGLTISQVESFLHAAFMNFYAIGAIVLLWLVVLWGIDFGPMRKADMRAAKGEGLLGEGEEALGELSEDVPAHEPGAMKTLLVPFLALVVGVVGGMYVTGGLNAGDWALTSVLHEADVALSLFIGGTLALAIASYYTLKYTRDNPLFTPGTFRRGVWAGAKSMWPAVLILLFAWTLADMIGEMETGEFLGGVVQSMNVPAIWLVPVLFVIAGIMAFATGTSWGSFGILLPLAGAMMAAVPGGDVHLLAAFGAVLAGAVWGDHSSPISDTTILSSTGAGCPVPAHVNTQLSYAFVGAVGALFGYVIYALTATGWIGLVSAVGLIFVIAAVLRMLYPPVEKVIEDEVAQRSA